MKIVSYSGGFSPEDKKFIQDCLEDDDLVLRVRRKLSITDSFNTTYTAIAWWLAGEIGCDMLIARRIVQFIVSNN